MLSHWRRTGFIVAILVMATSTLTACTVSLTGGIAGLIMALVFVGGLLFAGTSQSGCNDTDVGPCLSPIMQDSGDDVYVGPCLSSDGFGPCLSRIPPDLGDDVYIGPCLDPMPPDAGEDTYIGPCLDPIPPDAGGDTITGPCLSPALPDGFGPCLSIFPVDAGQDMHMGPCLSIFPVDAGQDMHMGPCLSIYPFDAAQDTASIDPPKNPSEPARMIRTIPKTVSDERKAVLAKVSNQLPKDVIARINKSSGNKKA